MSRLSREIVQTQEERESCDRHLLVGPSLVPAVEVALGV